MKRGFCLLLCLLLTAIMTNAIYAQEIKDNYVVLGINDGLTARIVAQGNFKFRVVRVNDTKRFSGGLVPMLEECTIDKFFIGNKEVALQSGKVSNGFIVTKDHGKIRLLGMENPFDMWVTIEQKDKMLKQKWL